VLCTIPLLSVYRLNTHEYFKSKWESGWGRGVPSDMSKPTDLIDSYMYSYMDVKIVKGIFQDQT